LKTFSNTQKEELGGCTKLHVVEETRDLCTSSIIGVGRDYGRTSGESEFDSR